MSNTKQAPVSLNTSPKLARTVTIVKDGKEITKAAWYPIGDGSDLPEEKRNALAAMHDAYALYSDARDACEALLTPNAAKLAQLEQNEMIAWSHQYGTAFSIVPKKVNKSKRVVSLA